MWMEKYIFTRLRSYYEAGKKPIELLALSLEYGIIAQWNETVFSWQKLLF